MIAIHGTMHMIRIMSEWQNCHIGQTHWNRSSTVPASFIVEHRRWAHVHHRIMFTIRMLPHNCLGRPARPSAGIRPSAPHPSRALPCCSERTSAWTATRRLRDKQTAVAFPRFRCYSKRFAIPPDLAPSRPTPMPEPMPLRLCHYAYAITPMTLRLCRYGDAAMSMRLPATRESRSS